MTEADDDLKRLFQDTATTTRDAAFVAKVMAETAKAPRAAPLPLSVFVGPLVNAAALALAGMVGAAVLQATSAPLLALLANPAVSYSLLAGAAALTFSLLFYRRDLVA